MQRIDDHGLGGLVGGRVILPSEANSPPLGIVIGLVSLMQLLVFFCLAEMLLCLDARCLGLLPNIFKLRLGL